MNRMINKLRSFRDDRSGNEAVSGLWVMLMLFFFAATLLFLLLYINRYTILSSECNLLVRQMEVSGVYQTDQIRAQLDRTMPDIDFQAYYVEEDGTLTPISDQAKLKFCENFRLCLTSRISFQYLIFGTDTSSDLIQMKLHCSADGMSEVYHKGD